MKRRSFIQKSAAVAGATVAFSPGATALGLPENGNKDVYELRVYQLTSGGAKTQLKNYLTGALMPLLNSKGGKVGIFSEYSLQEPPKLYVLCVYPNMQAYAAIQQEMDTNTTYQNNARAYHELPADKPLFTRYETHFMQAFESIPQLKQPAADRGLFELRIYESYNEDAGRRKILMFDKEELPLFEKIGLHPVFFGKNLAGSNIPALTYLLWFKDMAQREEKWASFRVHPEWVAMRDKPEYANTVSKVNKIFLLPESGSQI